MMYDLMFSAIFLNLRHILDIYIPSLYSARQNPVFEGGDITSQLLTFQISQANSSDLCHLCDGRAPRSKFQFPLCITLGMT